MSVYLRGNVWYIRLSIKGRRYHQAIPEATTKKEAIKAEAVFKAELLQGKYNLAEGKGTLSFKKLLEEYKIYAKANNISWKENIARAEKFADYFQNKTLSEIAPIHIDKYILKRRKIPKKNGQPISNTTINREIEILRKMFNIAIDNGWLDKNPCASVKKLRENNRKDRFLFPEEEIFLLKACTGEHSYLKPIIICALQTGMRKSEILNLEWKCVDFDKKYIILLETKSGKSRNIPISSAFMPILKDLYIVKSSNYVFNNPYTLQPYSDLKRAFPAVCKKANIEGLRFHDLRHTAATRMVAAGIDLVVVQEILGHADIKTTMRYSHPVPERKLLAVEALANFNKYANDSNIIYLNKA